MADLLPPSQPPVPGKIPLEESPIPTPPSPPKGRFVVVESVYHQLNKGEPTSFSAQHAHWLDTDEQPYLRQTKVGEAWQALDAGWLKAASVLLLKNEESVPDMASPQEKEEAASRVIEVAWMPEGWAGGDSKALGGSQRRSGTMWDPPPPEREIASPEAFWEVRPGESLRGRPVRLGRLLIRCRGGEARYTLVLIPG